MEFEKCTFTKLSIRIDAKPPYFIGSELRGAMGYALKQVVCINPSLVCNGCFATSNCLYYEFYEEKNSFHRYRFDFYLGAEKYDFSLYLFDSAASRLPYVISALHRLITQNGLGRERKTYREFSMSVNGEECMMDGHITLPKEYIKKFEIDTYCPNLTIKLLTPLRIKRENRFVRNDDLSLSDIYDSIYRRLLGLGGEGYKRFPYPKKGEIVDKKLEFIELKRRSNRQDTTMSLGGLVGEISVKNLSQEEYNILKIGELLGVGKQTVFGLGKIISEER